MPYTIYAGTVNDYTTVSQEWSVLRDGDSSVVDTINTSPASVIHQIQENSAKYIFTRTYMDFDLSSVVGPITSIDLYLYGETVTGATSYVVYGGTNKLSSNANDYQLYTDNLTAGGELSTITVQYRQYTSCQLNITDYPPTVGSNWYVIGIVASNDYLDTPGAFSAIEIANNSPLKNPYIVVNGGGGYPYDVSGVLGANITEVSGVPVANITDIMGV